MAILRSLFDGSEREVQDRLDHFLLLGPVSRLCSGSRTN